ncbi:MAG: 3-dehydroquinate dehydratase [Actinobacteria bacterium]|jgi:3-dehydroquinate dehydratase-2|nr:3-dehydroquinate dehydratase [Actinomycetota bacterium]
MSKVIIINGPNLNFLGIREIEKYGSLSYEDLKNKISEHAEGKNKIEFFQSNYEGEIVTYIQEIRKDTEVKGVVINPGGLTHSSVSLRDALSILEVPIIEVHITDIAKRESYRRINLISDLCTKSIVGKGIEGYIEGVDFLNEKN